MRTFTRFDKTEYTVEVIDYFPRLKDWYLTAEVETYNWLVNHADTNWVCLEVGGHIGEVSLLLSQLCSRVISFEPNKNATRMFRNNIEHNQRKGNGHFLNIEIVERPIGQHDGVMSETLWLAGSDDRFGETQGEFDFLSLDMFCRHRDDINWVSLIFIDADGWDYEVVLGADFIIDKCRPYIIMEANYALTWRGHSVENIYKWAEVKGYDCVYLDGECPGNMLLTPLNKYKKFENVYERE